MAGVEVTTSAAATESRYGHAAASPARKNFSGVDFALRLFLLACCVVSAVVLVTSKETELVPTGLSAPAFIPRAAKFQHSPAFIYLLAALSVAGVYSIITMLVSVSAISKTSPSAKTLFFLILFDVVMAGVMASATGTAGSVAYVGLRGNSHVNWKKICNVYSKFCWHVGSSVAVSLAGSVALVLLVILSSYSLFRRAAH